VVTPVRVAAWVGPVGNTEGRVWPGKAVTTMLPTVYVHDQFGSAMGGVLVKFTPSGSSTVRNATLLTEKYGTAQSGAWVMGAEEGVYTLTATVEGLPPVVFRAIAHKGVIIDAYKLLTIGGRELPEKEYGIIDGRLLFRDDSTFVLGYKGRVDVDSTNTSGSYTRTASGYMWDWGPFNLVTATLKDSTLYVHYQDQLDFEDEVYVRLLR
jgi:hypothetical protein